MTGIVSFYNRFKGWGFCVPDVIGPDFFIHVSSLPANHKYLNTGDRISFDAGEARGKPLATHIQIIQEAAAGGAR